MPPLSPLLARGHAAYALMHELIAEGRFQNLRRVRAHSHGQIPILMFLLLDPLQHRPWRERSSHRAAIRVSALGHIESMVLEDSEIVGLVAEIDKHPD